MNGYSISPINHVVTALNSANADEISTKRFLDLWPLIEKLLGSLPRVVQVPITAYLNDVEIYHGPCIGEDRTVDEKEVKRSRYIEIGDGAKFSILFGLNETDKSALTLQTTLPFEENEYCLSDPEDYKSLTQLNHEPTNPLSALADSLLDVVQQLLEDNIVRPALFSNMAHEVSIILLGMGYLSEEMKAQIIDRNDTTSEGLSVDSLLITQSSIRKECQLGLYTIRNFLSHTTERQYEKSGRSHYTPLDLQVILRDMVWLHEFHAAKKGIAFDVSRLKELPQVRGEEMEIRRMFHNVLNNAIKYSYHSIPSVTRTIKITSRIPFDPGFKRRRFSISIENLGIGVSPGEEKKVFKPGFRGQQAVSEVAVGSGIGLSEALKIMKAHSGEIKFRTKKLRGDDVSSTNLTTVELIFPFE